MGVTRVLLVDIAIAVLLVEALALHLHHRASGAGLPLAEILMTLAAGLFLMLALRVAVGQSALPSLPLSSIAADLSGPAIALLLAAAGIAHALDLRSRLRRAASRPSVRP